MSEISREEAQKILLQALYDGEFPNNSSIAFGKAIADMEKLEKVEKVVDNWLPTDLVAVESGRSAMRMINDILRGEE